MSSASGFMLFLQDRSPARVRRVWARHGAAHHLELGLERLESLGICITVNLYLDVHSSIFVGFGAKAKLPFKSGCTRILASDVQCRNRICSNHWNVAGPRNLTFWTLRTPGGVAEVNSVTPGLHCLQDIELPLTAKGVAFVESLGRVGGITCDYLIFPAVPLLAPTLRWIRSLKCRWWFFSYVKKGNPCCKGRGDFMRRLLGSHLEVSLLRKASSEWCPKMWG